MASWRSMGQACLTDDAVEDVADVLAAVGGRFQVPVELLPLDDLDGILLVVEQLDDRFLVDDVALVFEPVDLLRRPGDDHLVAQRLHRLLDLRRLVGEDAGQLAHAGPDAIEPIELHQLGAVVDRVGHVVERQGQRVDVLAVDGGHEGAVQPQQHVARQVVAAVLDVVDLGGPVPERLVGSDHLLE